MASIRIKGWHIVAIALIIVAMWYTGVLSFSIQGPQEQTPETQLVSVNKPLQFAVVDPLGGGGLASASVLVYGTDKVLKESLTTATDGYTAQTALPYQSGTTLYVKILKSGYVTRWMQVTVPKMTPTDAQAQTTNYISLQTVPLGTYTIKVTDQFGNVYTDGSDLNFTSLNVSTVSITISIYNTVDNTGYISSYDPLNGINLRSVLVLGTAGSDVSISGAGGSITRGTNSYWCITVNDDGLTRQIIGNQYVKPGVTSITFTINKGALSAGEEQDFTFTLYAYFDQTYFAQNGIGGPDASSLATFGLTLIG